MKARLAALMLLASLVFAQYLVTGNGTKTVATSGTAVQLTASNTIVKWVTIQALSSNTGTICVGGSTVLTSTKNGTCLTAGQAAPMYNMPGFPYDLSAIWIDATVNGEGVSYTYAQ